MSYLGLVGHFNNVGAGLPYQTKISERRAKRGTCFSLCPVHVPGAKQGVREHLVAGSPSWGGMCRLFDRMSGQIVFANEAPRGKMWASTVRAIVDQSSPSRAAPRLHNIIVRHSARHLPLVSMSVGWKAESHMQKHIRRGISGPFSGTNSGPLEIAF